MLNVFMLFKSLTNASYVALLMQSLATMFIRVLMF